MKEKRIRIRIWIWMKFENETEVWWNSYWNDNGRVGLLPSREVLARFQRKKKMRKIKRRSHKLFFFFLLLLSSSLVEFVTGGLPGSFRSWTWREGCNSTPLLREPVEPRGFSTSFHSFSFFSFLFFLLSSRPCSGHYLRTLLLILGPW